MRGAEAGGGTQVGRAPKMRRSGGALQNLAEVRERKVAAPAFWSAAALCRFRIGEAMRRSSGRLAGRARAEKAPQRRRRSEARRVWEAHDGRASVLECGSRVPI